MTLFEKIKGMTKDELAEYIVHTVVIAIGAEQFNVDVYQAMLEAARASMDEQVGEDDVANAVGEEGEKEENVETELTISGVVEDDATNEATDDGEQHFRVLAVDPNMFAKERENSEEKIENSAAPQGEKDNKEIQTSIEEVEEASPEGSQDH